MIAQKFVKTMIKDIIFKKIALFCGKIRSSKNKKEKNFRILSVKSKNFVRRFECLNCFELIVFIGNNQRKKVY